MCCETGYEEAEERRVNEKVGRRILETLRVNEVMFWGQMNSQKGKGANVPVRIGQKGGAMEGRVEVERMFQ